MPHSTWRNWAQLALVAASLAAAAFLGAEVELLRRVGGPPMVWCGPVTRRARRRLRQVDDADHDFVDARPHRRFVDLAGRARVDERA
jgi:hypothetical protein